LVILIDDLDRCQPEDVLKILEAVNYLASAGPCTIVIGMDRRQVEYSVGMGFEKLVEGLPEDELIYAFDERSGKIGKQRAFARHYLEKLINIEVPVPPLDEAATDAMLLRDPSAVHGPDVDGPAWLATSKRFLSNAFQIARVGLVAYVVGLLLAGAVYQVRVTDASDVLGKVESTSDPMPTQHAPSLSSGESAASPSPQESEFTPVRSLTESVPSLRQMPGSGQWIWWTPTVLVLGIALLFGIALAVHRERQIVRDSPDFAKALRAVKPLITAGNPTPRAIKRYQNRMRYLAARLRPPMHEPDSFDSLLDWLGRKIGRQIVPAAWFADRPRQMISEPALILLGAIELLAPSSFASPAKLYAALHGTSGEASSDEHFESWMRVRASFKKDGLELPTIFEIERYSSFVLALGRPSTSEPGEVLNFPRDPSSGPMPAM
jgi:hypothetical protein